MASPKTLCPYCEKDISPEDVILIDEIDYCTFWVCPHCRKILNVGYKPKTMF